MATEVKRLIRVRTDKGASFKRDGFGKKRQLSDSWRKPRGQHNKQREHKKAKGALPQPGYGSPVAVRGMHPSGFFEALVSTIKELEGLDPKTHAVRISATVGDKKRVALQEAALGKGLKVLNARAVKAPAKKAPAKKEAAKPESSQKNKTKPAASQKKSAAPAKKEAAKEKPAAKTEEKKAPAKKAAAKPKTESAEKPVEKKAPVKKTAAKPKAESDEKKAPAKKTTKSGVKKNE
ncbi:MAG: 50S ribosomal protein L32e [Methanomicrobiales archaeon HGW-Methanomicrobiales-3]|jgi:large subunit ribosomal protein L32e|nr:MAG: 50S ribosomal protein L32e [Methanomicrobiales archaeon HGW-Methanomicrobiales-3]